MALDIGKQIAELKQMTVRELREKYETVFGEPTPESGRDADSSTAIAAAAATTSLRQAKPGKGESDVEAETSRWNPAGSQSRPAKPGRQPEASLAWLWSDPSREA